MSTPPNHHKPCCTQAIDAWGLAAQEQRAQLYRQAPGSWKSDEHYAVFAGMSELLLAAFEEMRMISAALREDSAALRSHAHGLRVRSQQLFARQASAAEPSWRCPTPTREDVPQAESQLLEMFKGARRPSEQ